MNAEDAMHGLYRRLIDGWNAGDAGAMAELRPASARSMGTSRSRASASTSGTGRDMREQSHWLKRSRVTANVPMLRALAGQELGHRARITRVPPVDQTPVQAVHGVLGIHALATS